MKRKSSIYNLTTAEKMQVAITSCAENLSGPMRTCSVDRSETTETIEDAGAFLKVLTEVKATFTVCEYVSKSSGGRK